jgi:GT2 family glycosyltransferase
MPAPIASLVTPNLNGREHLRTLLGSVRKQDFPADGLEIIVVDNGSSDGSVPMLERDFPDVRVLRNDVNTGFARSNNQAAAVARGKYLALVNNDVRLERDWLSTVVGRAEESPGDVVCFGTALRSWDGHQIDFLDAGMSFAGVGFHVDRGAPVESGAGTRGPGALLYASGAAALVERETFLDVGGFDESYFNYYEDVDLGWRLWILGFRVESCPDAVAYHHRNASIGARHETVYLLERNALFSVVKNYEDETLEKVLPAALLLVAGRARARSEPAHAGFLRRVARRIGVGSADVIVSRDALASFRALEAVATAMPALVQKRREVQARRRRSDAEIIPLLRDPLRGVAAVRAGGGPLVIALTDAQLEELQNALPWETAMRLPDGRVLGVPGKRGAISESGDFRVDAVATRMGGSGKRVLELGCHEGIHTVQLARVAREVVALDVRPKNIVCALARLYVHEVDNARLVLGDARSLDGSLGRFDIVFHVGVLYHLLDPVEHLYGLASLGDELLLDTHYGSPNDPGERETLERGGRRYETYRSREGGWGDSFSGVDQFSRWLTRDSLIELVCDAGYCEIDVTDDRVERNGARITLIGRKA